jgi:hypothetical protein
MDIDMHYYGTYALARAAGLRADVAQRIATAAEFVDDSTETQVMVNPQGARFRGEATAHHPSDFRPNNDRDDQIMVWLPFHFLPGNDGANQSQKLVCRKDSTLAREMVAHHLDLADTLFSIALMGITAHVYSDTFAHYGFSGVSSRTNRVDSGSFDLKNGAPLTGRIERFVGKFGLQGGLMKNFRDAVSTAVGEAAQDTTGALGHGAVAVFPDQPYLDWAYTYELPESAGAGRIERQNIDDYMQAAAALHGMFSTFARRRPEYADNKARREFDDIKAAIRGIVGLIADVDGRIAAWQKALVDGTLTGSPDKAVAPYNHQEWRNQTNLLQTIPDPQGASGLPAYHFHQAAALHRNFVLRQLLPKHGLYVI